jgi:hypothetical protein
MTRELWIKKLQIQSSDSSNTYLKNKWDKKLYQVLKSSKHTLTPSDKLPSSMGLASSVPVSSSQTCVVVHVNKSCKFYVLE